MKKLAIFLLCILLAVALVACNAPQTGESSSMEVSSTSEASSTSDSKPEGNSSSSDDEGSSVQTGPGGGPAVVGGNATGQGPGGGEPNSTAPGRDGAGGGGAAGQPTRPPAANDGSLVPTPPTASGAQAAPAPYNLDFDKLNKAWQNEMTTVNGVTSAQVQASGPMITLLVVVKDNFDKTGLNNLKDEMLTRYNNLARGQDSQIKAAGNGSYGGLYDKYAVTVGIATQNEKDNPSGWMLNELVAQSNK